MKLHPDLRITQKSAWQLAHRIRENWRDLTDVFEGPAEVDETFIGGKRKNMPASKRRELTGRGTAGKTAVVGIKDRKTKRVKTKVVRNTDAETLQGFDRENVKPGAKVFTDEAAAYKGLSDYQHEAVKHGVGEFVRGRVHTNHIESVWSMLKRGYMGTYHKMSVKHLDKHVAELEGRHNCREYHTIDQMEMAVRGMEGKRLRYRDLTDAPGPSRPSPDDAPVEPLADRQIGQVVRSSARPAPHHVSLARYTVSRLGVPDSRLLATTPAVRSQA